MHAKSSQSCLTLCNLMDCSPPGFSVHGILQAGIPGVGCHALLPGDLPNLGIEPTSLLSPALAARFFTTSATWEAPKMGRGTEKTFFQRRHTNGHLAREKLLCITNH